MNTSNKRQPWEITLGVPYGISAKGLVWEQGKRNKLNIPLVPSYHPKGFDKFPTPQGLAIRFIGSGMETPETCVFELNLDVSVLVSKGRADCHFAAITRPYGEPDIYKARELNECQGIINFCANGVGHLSIKKRKVTLSTGDLLEVYSKPVCDFEGVEIPAGVIHLREVRK